MVWALILGQVLHMEDLRVFLSIMIVEIRRGMPNETRKSFVLLARLAEARLFYGSS